MEDVYIAVTSPGIPPKSELMQKLKEKKNIMVISEIELAYLETRFLLLQLPVQTEKQQQRNLQIL